MYSIPQTSAYSTLPVDFKYSESITRELNWILDRAYDLTHVFVTINDQWLRVISCKDDILTLADSQLSLLYIPLTEDTPKLYAISQLDNLLKEDDKVIIYDKGAYEAKIVAFTQWINKPILVDLNGIELHISKDNVLYWHNQ